MYDYDIVIVGGGPGGYIAASYASQFGKRVAVIEKEFIGGCCLNVGCIPTKTILEAATRYIHATKSESYGIVSQTVFEWNKFKKYSVKVISELRNGIDRLLKSRKCDLINGEAVFIDSHMVEAAGKKITADIFIIATGSKPAVPNKYASLKNVLSSDSFWNLDKQPESMVIVGGGVIGCEIASALSRLGTRITIIEKMADILSVFDTEAVKMIKSEMAESGVDFLCGNAVEDVKNVSDGLEVNITEKNISCEYVLWATGRRPIIPKTNNVNIEITDSGFVKVDSNYRTSIPNIYAVGDVNGKGMFAHAAISQAMLAVNHICTGMAISANPYIPQTVFTYPSVARIGKREEECKNTAVGKIPYTAVGYSHVTDSTKGYFKVIRDIETDTLIGAEIVGYNACELIHVLAPLINKKIEVGMFMDTMFAHPTLSEGIKLAVEASYIRSPQL